MLNSGRDLAIICVYDSPENSSYKFNKRQKGDDIQNESTLDTLLDLIGTLSDCDLLIVGDFNARTGDLNFTQENEDWENTQGQLDLSGTRTSEDELINERGNKFLDLLCSTNLSLLNGCTLGDIFGNFTCARYNGNSVVDYGIVAPGAKELVKTFEILNLSNFSDHKPLRCRVKATKSSTPGETLMCKYQDAPRRPKWDINTYTNWLEKEETANSMNSLLSTDIHDEFSLRSLNDGLCRLIQAHSVQPHDDRTSKDTGAQETKKRPRPRFKNKWFDPECLEVKRNLNKTTRKYGKNPTDADIRSLYYSSKKEYRNLLKRKKRCYLQQLNTDLTETSNIDWNTLKALKETSSKDDTLDIFDMECFQTFFAALYTEKRVKHPLENPVSQQIDNDLGDLLNSPITSVNLKDL